MKQLQERIRRDAVYLGDGIVKVDTFLNHQIDPALMEAIGEALAEPWHREGITRVVTAEVSGIPPALMTARRLKIPVIYARKGEPVTMGEDCLRETVHSRTGGTSVTLKIARHLLGQRDRVLLIDDFLARGATLRGLAAMVHRSGARLCGIGCAVEKPFEGGRSVLEDLQVPIHTLARIEIRDEQVVVT